MTEFNPMPKISRLSREIVVTEKLDGTNASVWLRPIDGQPVPPGTWEVGDFYIAAGSRTRWITPEDDNFGFARWVRDNSCTLVGLGEGHHFGEWWGGGIQRGYGLKEKRFSLFNVGRWSETPGEGQELKPHCCHVVPVLYHGPFFMENVETSLEFLRIQGSNAAPGFMNPEGIVVYHTASNALFKKTIKGDEEGKHAEAHPKKDKPPRPPKDPSTGGRRKAQVPFEGEERRHARTR